VKKIIAVVALLCLASVALAASAPVVNSPKDGDKIGPSVYLNIQTEGKQFVIVITDVYVRGNDKPVGSVPGIRHWTNDDGALTVRISTPRVVNAKKSDITYKIRVFTATPSGEKSPETIVTCYPE